MQAEATIAAKIVEILQTSPGRRMLGTSLASTLAQTVGFKSEVHGRLRDFVDNHVPAVARIEQSGKDWIYAINGPAVSVSQPYAASTPEFVIEEPVWRTYASPKAAYRLYGNSETGDLRVQAPGEPSLSHPWKLIDPYPSKSHLEDATEWVNSLVDPTKKFLLQNALQSGTDAHGHFYKSVVTLDLAPDWNRFRRARILKGFQSQLRELGIPLSKALSESVASQRDSLGAVRHGHANIEDRMLRILIGVVDRMPDADLRELMTYILLKQLEVPVAGKSAKGRTHEDSSPRGAPGSL